MDIDKIKKSVGTFTWFWSHLFFVETEYGNFLWSDPDYNGDDSFTIYDGQYDDYCRRSGNTIFGRDKGKHIVEEYCGPDIWIKAS